MRTRLLAAIVLLASTVSFAQSAIDVRLREISKSAKGRVGFAALHIEKNQRIAMNEREAFPMQSVYKLPIAMCALEQVDRGRLSLTQKVKVTPADYIGQRQHSPVRDKYPNGTELTLQELIAYAVSESDGSASDVLLRVAGGPQQIMSYLQQLGVREMHILDTEMLLGRDAQVQYRNSATPESAIQLLTALQTGKALSQDSRAFLLKLMTDTPTGPRRIKGDLYPNTVVAHKTGSSGTVNGRTAATNDIGIITLPDGNHLAVAVFVSDSMADTAAREGVIARLARAAFDYWTLLK